VKSRREGAFDRLLTEIRACRTCIEAPLGKPLPHQPRPVVRARRSAVIAVCGQAPGTRVHASGLPFDDPSGVRLRDWMGVTVEEFYDDRVIAVLPMGFCFPGLDAKGGDLPPRRELVGYIKKAMKLNEDGVKPPRARAAKAKAAATVPADLRAALAKNRKAAATFAAFAPSHRREYIEWIVGAKRAETRAKRLATTLEWLAEGKKHSWRYEKC